MDSENSEYVLVLKWCNPDLTGYGGFQWPTSGYVESPNWDPDPESFYGLHGWLWGEGSAHMSRIQRPDNSTVWVVVRVRKDVLIAQWGAVKFPYGEVVFVGNQLDATEYIKKNGGAGRAIIGASCSVPGECVAVVGSLGTAESGVGGTSIAGDNAVALSDDYGFSGSRVKGTSISLERGVAFSEYLGTSIVGRHGLAVTGICGKAQAGEHGVLLIRSHNPKKEYGRWIVGYIGENGLKPNVLYMLDTDNNFVPAEQKSSDGESMEYTR